jgi:hypothetical protein
MGSYIAFADLPSQTHAFIILHIKGLNVVTIYISGGDGKNEANAPVYTTYYRFHRRGWDASIEATSPAASPLPPPLLQILSLIL